jgi:hypothetical protein
MLNAQNKYMNIMSQQDIEMGDIGQFQLQH